MKAAALVMSGTLFVLKAFVTFTLTTFRSWSIDRETCMWIAVISMFIGLGFYMGAARADEPSSGG